MTTSLMIHNVTSIRVREIRTSVAQFGGEYTSRAIEITDRDGHTFQITVFGRFAADLAFEMPQPVSLAAASVTPTTTPEAA